MSKTFAQSQNNVQSIFGVKMHIFITFKARKDIFGGRLGVGGIPPKKCGEIAELSGIGSDISGKFPIFTVPVPRYNF